MRDKTHGQTDQIKQLFRISDIIYLFTGSITLMLLLLLCIRHPVRDNCLQWIVYQRIA